MTCKKCNNRLGYFDEICSVCGEQVSKEDDKAAKKKAIKRANKKGK